MCMSRKDKFQTMITIFQCYLSTTIFWLLTFQNEICTRLIFFKMAQLNLSRKLLTGLVSVYSSGLWSLFFGQQSSNKESFVVEDGSNFWNLHIHARRSPQNRGFQVSLEKVLLSEDWVIKRIPLEITTFRILYPTIHDTVWSKEGMD